MATYGSGYAMPDAALSLSGISYTTGKYYPQFGGANCVCKGARLATGASSGTGVLMVHPVRGGVDSYPIDLTAGDPPQGFEFDFIVETDTTVDLTKTYVFPK